MVSAFTSARRNEAVLLFLIAMMRHLALLSDPGRINQHGKFFVEKLPPFGHKFLLISFLHLYVYVRVSGVGGGRNQKTELP